MPISQRQLEKEQSIKKEVKDLRAQGYRYDWIFEHVADKYYLLPATVARIFWGEYDARRERVSKQSAANLNAL